jgi:hypothetical protein
MMSRAELKPVTPERLAELQGGEWVYGFMERYPKMFEIRRGSEDAYLEGLIDVHVHANPDSLAPRSQDLIDVVIEYAHVGARAVVHKDHHYSSVGVAHMAQRMIDDLVARGELTNQIQVYGGVPLAYTVDPGYVERAIRFPQMRMIYANCIFGEVLVRAGKVLPEMVEIIKIAAHHGIPILLCPSNHSVKYQEDDYDVVVPLVEAITEHGGKAFIDHPITAYTVEQTKALADLGAYIGLFCYPTIPDVIKAPVVDPELTKEMIDAVGPERCVLGSDKGHVLEPDALHAMRLMLRLLLTWGYTPEQIRAMASENAQRMLFEKPA